MRKQQKAMLLVLHAGSLRGIAAACLLLLTGAAAAQDARAVRGRVVDAAGEPVAQVQIGTLWEFESDAAKAWWRADVYSRQNPEVRSDASGAFAADLYFRGRPVALFAVDMSKSRGGIVIVNDDNIDDEQVLTLQPLVHLRGRVEITEPTLAGNRVYIYAFDPRAPIAITRSVPTAEGEFSFHLPAGAYKLTFGAKDLQPVSREVVLETGAGMLDLGAIDLFATNLAEHYGKPPPAWNITEARGVSPDIELSDYRGKWVLIETWSYW